MRERVSLRMGLFIAILAAGPLAAACLSGYPPGKAEILIAGVMFILYVVTACVLRSAMIFGALVGVLAANFLPTAPGGELSLSILGTIGGAAFALVFLEKPNKPKAN